MNSSLAAQAWVGDKERAVPLSMHRELLSQPGLSPVHSSQLEGSLGLNQGERENLFAHPELLLGLVK